MSEREDIINYILNLINDFPEVNTVTRVVKSFDALSTSELPQITVIDGEEIRNYEGPRMIAAFQVHLRIIDDRSNVNKVSTFLNDLISQIEKRIENDPYLGGHSAFPIRIIRIDTDEGWMFPFMFANIVLETYYTRVVNR